LDRLIDDVARVMTEASPSAGLRDAVLARIERRPVHWRAWLLVPVTAAAAVVLAIALRGPASRPDPVRMPPHVETASNAPAPSLAAVPPEATGAALRIPRVRRSSPRMAQVRTIPALAEPAALVAHDIQPDALAIPLLRMKPIVTEPIAIKVIDDLGARQ
jgi:hypothetical protein